MALVINDRVKENSTTTGTGDIALAGVPSGEGTITFNTGIGTGTVTVTPVQDFTIEPEENIYLELY